MSSQRSLLNQPVIDDDSLPRLRIAFVVDRFGNRFGGAEAYGVELMRQLAPKHDITVIAREYDPACDLQLSFTPVRLWSKWPSWIRAFLFARQAARLTRHGFDLVHSHMNGWAADVDVVHVTPVRYRWRVAGRSLWSRVNQALSPRIACYLKLEKERVRPRAGHVVVAVSSLIDTQLQQAYQSVFPGQSYPVITPGVQLQAYQPEHSERERVRAQYEWADTDQVCLLVARNPLRKGLKTALLALAQLPAHYKLLVVGGHSDLAVQLQGELAALGLAERAVFIEATSMVEPYYRAADMYVHPTLNDSFGMAPMEAMSFGLPVVVSASPWCGFADYLEHEKTALVLQHPEDAQDLAALVQRIGEHPHLADSLRRQALALIQEHYTWPSVARAYLDLYKQVLAEKA